MSEPLTGKQLQYSYESLRDEAKRTQTALGGVLDLMDGIKGEPALFHEEAKIILELIVDDLGRQLSALAKCIGS